MGEQASLPHPSAYRSLWDHLLGQEALVSEDLPERVLLEDGTEEYRLNGKRHRADGPAIIWADGAEEYWVEGKRVQS
jgi:hypothetical protein